MKTKSEEKPSPAGEANGRASASPAANTDETRRWYESLEFVLAHMAVSYDHRVIDGGSAARFIGPESTPANDGRLITHFNRPG